MNLIRTVKVKLRPDAHARNLLDRTARVVHDRARVWAEVMLAFRGESVTVRRGSSLVVQGPDVWEHKLLSFCGRLPSPAERELVRAVYDNVSRGGRTGGYVNPLKRAGAKANSKGEGFEAVRALQASGLLPLRVGDVSNGSLDYTAFEMMKQHLANWEEHNKMTQAAYATAVARRDARAPGDEDHQALAEYEARYTVEGAYTSGFVTEKLVTRIRQYGFDVRHCVDAMKWCEARNDDPEYWARLFDYRLAERKLKRLRPDSVYTFPDVDASVRPVCCGTNYLDFKIRPVATDRIDVEFRLLDGDQMTWVRIPAAPTNQMRGLTVEGHAVPFTLNYRKGNQNNDPVVGTVREISFYKTAGRSRREERRRRDRRRGPVEDHPGSAWFARLPINIETEADETAADVASRFYAEPGVVDVPAEFRVLSADMGLNPAWAFKVWEGGRPIEEGHIGGVGVRKDMAKIRRMIRRNRGLSFLVTYLKKLESGVTVCKKFQAHTARAFAQAGLPPCSDAKVLRETLRQAVYHHRKSYRQLKDHLTTTKPRTNPGVHAEMFQWVFCVKGVVSLLKRWCFYGKEPVAGGGRRPGFETYSDYLSRYKDNTVKMFAQALVAHARRRGCRVVVIEDLDIERSRATRSRHQNELAAVWSPATIRSWLRHFAAQHGIKIVTVDPAYTSQIDPQTGRLGWRSRRCKTHLWVERGPDVVCVDADLAAAENIYLRFVDRPGSVNQLWAQRVENPEEFGLAEAYRPLLEKVARKKNKGADGGEGGDRPWKKTIREHLLVRTYGTSRVLLIPGGGALVLDERQLKAVRVHAAKVRLFRDGDRWLTEDARKARQAALQSRVLGRRPPQGSCDPCSA